jgi:hypothetical protein
MSNEVEDQPEANAGYADHKDSASLYFGEY